MKDIIKNNGKTKTATITLILLLIVSMPILIQTQSAKAVKAVPDRETTGFLSFSPYLIGVKQDLLVNLWVYPPPLGPNYEMGAQLKGEGGIEGLHFENISITFTRPDGSKDTFKPLDGTAGNMLKAGETEESGTMWFMYKPSQIGSWSAQFSFPGESYSFLNYTVYYKPSTSQVVTFEVQQDNVSIGLPAAPLPTNYWTRPINSDYREWSAISGAWFGNIKDNFNPYSTAPNSAHILWKQEVALGGLVGGEWGGLSFAGGGGSPGLVFNGRIYYNLNRANGTQMECVDLRTGEKIWETAGSISGGQIVLPTGMNEYSSIPAAYLWSYSATAWKRYDAYTGALSLNLPIVMAVNPSRLPVWINSNIAYTVRQPPFGTGWNTTITDRLAFSELIMWNLSKPGSTWDSKVQWSVSLKQPDGTGPGEGSRTSYVQPFPDLGICIVYTSGEPLLYAYDLNTGKQLWIYDIGWSTATTTWAPNDIMIATKDIDMSLHAFKVTATGLNPIWDTVLGEYPWGSNKSPKGGAYGNYYYGAYDGYLSSVNLATGKLNWQFFTGNTTETPYGVWPLWGGFAAADGKVYFSETEHSPTEPRTRGDKLFCVDATTGEELWNISGAISPRAIAEGYLVGASENDGFMYCFGKGPTETTVSAPLTALTLGGSLTVQGTVMDMSPASANTPAISDNDMSAWMNYVHMQQPEPMTAPYGDSWGTPVDVKGVEVSLDTIDPNNNFVHIANVTSDSNGLYSTTWEPEIPGKYTVIATFAGSESYWASHAETAVSVVEAASTPSSLPEQISTDFTPMYIVAIAAAIAIIIAVAIVGILLLRKKA